MPRRFPIVQFPNAPLLAAMLAAAIAHTANGASADTAALVSKLALLDWAHQELASGANWFRRLLGLAAGAYSVVTLKRPRTGRSDRCAVPHER